LFVLVISWYNKDITKLNWLNQKRALLVAGAVVFLVVLFFWKNGIFNKEKIAGVLSNRNSADNVEILQDLINRDTDGDGIVDWEENLWGTDPRNKDTNGDGVPDDIEIAKLKSEAPTNPETSATIAENLTKTDEFSRELFSTIATLNQGGEIDQATIDKLGSSLAEQIQNATPKKVFTASDIKIIASNTNTDFLNYNNSLNKIYERYPIKIGAIEILQEFVSGEENTSADVLSKLDPIIEQTNKIINELVETGVPSDLAQIHLDFINGLERPVENLSDLQLFDQDPIIALGAISKYEENVALLESAIIKLGNAIRQKLNN